MGLSHRISIDSTLPKPHSVLVEELAHQSIMPMNASSQSPTYGTPQPTTSASMVPKHSQQFNSSLSRVQRLTPNPKFSANFSQIATSVTEYPLPPAMREFKTSQISTVHPTSSPLPQYHHPFSLKMEGLVSPVQYSTSPSLQPIIP
ncbi:hypothetical protein AVEN_50224-1 [Araneus ventricosus]|uniref:Uncharacterized protein n=1 Tax=Araneus ventricosus TaxID=182803 RepID=A0A4Y2RIE0_ARAVE|nr:hypothetical protein AVEN_50224-1 [Araneus ventricosus]